MIRRLFLSALAMSAGVALAAPQTPTLAPAPKPEPTQPQNRVDIQMRLINCPAAMVAALDNQPCDSHAPDNRFLTEQQVAQFIERAKAESRCTIIAAPRVVTADRESATVRTQRAVPVVSGVRVSLEDGQLRTEKECQIRECGFNVMVTPELSSDRCFIGLTVVAESTDLAANSPIAHSIRVNDQVVELCQPAFTVRRIRSSAKMAAGKTMLIELPSAKSCTDESCEECTCLLVTPCVAPCAPACCAQRAAAPTTCDESCEPRPPVAAAGAMMRLMPAMQQGTMCAGHRDPNQPGPLFFAIGVPKPGVNEADHFVFLASPRMMPPMPCQPGPFSWVTPIASIDVVEQSEPREPMREPNPTLTKLMAKYDRACAEGDTEKARKLARRCLDIDPKCFSQAP